MTNADIVLAALTTLESARKRGLHNATDVMRQVRRDGWQIDNGKALNVLKVLARRGQVQQIKEGRRYYFRTAVN